MCAAEMKMPGMASELIMDLRGTLEWLKSEGDLMETDVEVDPDIEIAAIQKNLDGGCPILFNNVKGKPNHRCVTNLFGDMNVVNKMFGWTDDTDPFAGLNVEGDVLMRHVGASRIAEYHVIERNCRVELIDLSTIRIRHQRLGVENLVDA